MNFEGFTSRSDVQDSDQVIGYRSPVSGGEGRWTFAVLKAWVKGFLAKGDVGLGNVDNTSDANKPVSTAAQAALDAKADASALATHVSDVANPHGVTKAQVGLGSVTNDAQVKRSEMGQPSGVATLDGGGKIPAAQIPSIALTDFLGAVGSQAAMLALSGEGGDWATRTDTGTNWVIIGSDPTQLSSWREFTYPASPVSSVAGRTGAVTLSTSDIGGLAAVASSGSASDLGSGTLPLGRLSGITDAQLSGTAAIALSKLATDPLARANHTGTQLASTISDFTSAVRTATARPVFNVKDYGATGNGVTDDTAAVQATIDAAATAGGGTIFFPAGVYLCDGAFQVLSAGIKTILKLPDVPYASGANEYLNLTFAGPIDVPWNFSVISAQVPTSHGAIIKTTQGSTTGGPSLIAGYSTDASADNFTLVFATFRNLVIRCPSNPQISGLNMGKVGQALFDNVVVDTGVAGSDCPLGTHSWATGIVAPIVNNAAFTRFRDCAVAGFYTGFAFDEHCDVDNCSAWYCEAAIQFPTTNHVMRVGRFLAAVCHDVIKVVTQGTLPRSTFLIEQLGIEHEPGLYRYDINDGGSVGYGAVSYHIVRGGTGPMNSEWSVNGATHVVATALENGGAGGAQTPWLSNENANGFSLSNLAGLAMVSTLTTDSAGAEALGVLNSQAKGRSGVTAGNNNGTLRGVGIFAYGPTQGTYGKANTASLAFYGPLGYAAIETNFDNAGACDLYIRTAGGFFNDTTHFSGCFRKNATDGGNQADWDIFGATTFRKRESTQTANFTVGNASGQDWDVDNKKSGTTFNNIGATGLITGTWYGTGSAVNRGAHYNFYDDNGNGIKVVVPAGVTIVYNGSSSSSGGYIQSSAAGSYITLEAITTTKVIATGSGTWAVG